MEARKAEMVTHLAMGFSSVHAFLWCASAVGMNVLELEGDDMSSNN